MFDNSLVNAALARLGIAELGEGRDVCRFDEPSSGLDHRAMRAVSAVVRDLARAGAVVVLITHDAELVDECADRVVELTAAPGSRTLDAEVRQP